MRLYNEANHWYLFRAPPGRETDCSARIPFPFGANEEDPDGRPRRPNHFFVHLLQRRVQRLGPRGTLPRRSRSDEVRIRDIVPRSPGQSTIVQYHLQTHTVGHDSQVRPTHSTPCRRPPCSVHSPIFASAAGATDCTPCYHRWQPIWRCLRVQWLFRLSLPAFLSLPESDKWWPPQSPPSPSSPPSPPSLSSVQAATAATGIETHTTCLEYFVSSFAVQPLFNCFVNILGKQRADEGEKERKKNECSLYHGARNTTCWILGWL